MPENEHHIKVKLGSFEFEARGAPDVVEKQYTSFLEATSQLNHTEKSDSQMGSDRAGVPASERADPDSEIPPSNSRELVDGSVSPELLERIYQVDENLVSLTALPDDKTDALLMLIYGNDVFDVMKKVTGATLGKGAKQSGLHINRIDRLLNQRRDLVLAGGANRGRRYHLNNQGKAYVEKLLSEME